jgi:hypothetical protein
MGVVSANVVYYVLSLDVAENWPIDWFVVKECTIWSLWNTAVEHLD